MKRVLIAAIAVLMIALTFVSCYDPYAGIKDKSKKPTAATQSSTKKKEETKKKKVSDKKYEDNLNGLRDFMKDSGYIKVEDNNVTKMQADLIGAKKGNKYVDGDTRVELYEFDLKKDNKKRDETVESVKNDGSFTVYSEKIPAYLSDSGKYLMVYTNPTADDKNSDAYKTKQNAVKAFKGYKAK